MSHIVNSELEERAYEVGYDEGYKECKNEIMSRLPDYLKDYMLKNMEPIPALNGVTAYEISKIFVERFGAVLDRKEWKGNIL